MVEHVGGTPEKRPKSDVVHGFVDLMQSSHPNKLRSKALVRTLETYRVAIDKSLKEPAPDLKRIQGVISVMRDSVRALSFLDKPASDAWETELNELETRLQN